MNEALEERLPGRAFCDLRGWRAAVRAAPAATWEARVRVARREPRCRRAGPLEQLAHTSSAPPAASPPSAACAPRRQRRLQAGRRRRRTRLGRRSRCTSKPTSKTPVAASTLGSAGGAPRGFTASSTTAAGAGGERRATRRSTTVSAIRPSVSALITAHGAWRTLPLHLHAQSCACVRAC